MLESVDVVSRKKYNKLITRNSCLEEKNSSRFNLFHIKSVPSDLSIVGTPNAEQVYCSK